ncbi:MAG: FHA domain-containing protein, partial [Deinococcales bacterium]
LLIAENTLGLRGRWWRDLLWVLPMSALLGLGGALFGQLLFALFGEAARIVGWAVVGTIAGAVLGLADRSRAKALRGAIGGTVGGVVGGIVFSALTGVFSSGVLELLGRLLGLGALGFAVGLMLQLVQQALKTAWLTGITTGVYEGKQYILGKPVVTVGRSDGNDIGLYREKTLALKLGAFKFGNGRWVYEGDPVAINGNPSSRAVLSSGDTIQFGTTEFLFESKGDAPTPEEKGAPAMPASTSVAAPASALLPAAPKPWRLVGTETLELPFGKQTLGRGEHNGIVLREGSVSTEHARLEMISDSLTVTDLGSTNGTFLDGQQLPAHQPFVVQEGAKLAFGAAEFRVAR